MRVKLTALVGDNAASGLLLDGNYTVHQGPDAQGRVWVFDEGTDSFRAVSPAEYREVRISTRLEGLEDVAGLGEVGS